MKNKILNIVIILIILFLTFEMLLVLHSWLFLKVDDWCYAASHGLSASEIVSMSIVRYQIWSGRFFVSMLELFAANNVLIWKIVNPLIILVIIYLIIVISSKEKFFSPKNIIPLLLLVSLVFKMDIELSREVFYWLSGSVNYIWPTSCVLLFIAVWTRFLTHEGKENRFYYFILPILSVLAGCSHEQIGAVAVLFVAGTLMWRLLVSKKCMNRFHITVFGLLIMSYMVMLFAPGNFVRIKEGHDGSVIYYQSGLLGKTTLQIHDILSSIYRVQSFVFSELLLMAIIVINIVFEKKKYIDKNGSRIILAFIVPNVCLLLLLYGSMHGWWKDVLHFQNFLQFKNGIPIIRIWPYLFFIVSHGSILFYAIRFSKAKRNPKFLLLILSCFISQCVMVFAPFVGYRTFFITIVLLWCSIVYLATRFDNKLISIVFGMFVICYSLGIIKNFTMLREVFKNNYVVNIENEKKILNHLNSDDRETLTLSKLSNDRYNFLMPYQEKGDSREWMDECFKKYYVLDPSTSIEWDIYRQTSR